MKRVFILTCACLLTTALAGCNRGWPGLFCSVYNDDCCEVIESGSDCCNSSSYYAPSGSTIEYAPAPTSAPVRSRVDELPMPGPDRSSNT